MPQVEILIKTKAELQAMQQAIDAFNRKGKAAEDVTKKLEAMDKAEQAALKTQRVFGDQAEQNAAHLSKLTKEAKESGAAAEKTAGLKGKWLDAIKKLQAEVPGLSYVVGALKNPFVALIAVIAISINWLAEFNAKIQRLREIVGDGKIGEQFNRIGEILGNAEVRAKAFAKALAEIENRPETVPELIARAEANAERQFALEEASDKQAKEKELAGAATPEAKAAVEAKYDQRAADRAQRRLGSKANIAAQGVFRNQDIVREGEAQLPAMQQMLIDAEERRDQMIGLADANTTSPEKLKEIEDELAAIEAPGVIASIKRGAIYGLGSAGFQNMVARRDSLREILANARAGNQMAGRLRTTATGDFEAAQERFNKFSAGVTAAKGQVRSFGIQHSAANADFAAFQPINTPGAEAFAQQVRQVQARYEALAKTLLDALDQTNKKVQNATSRERKTANDP